MSHNPIFNLYTSDIEEAYVYVQNKGIKIVRELEWAGETAWFNIQDPDGNVIMIANC
ncbi:VOC family protein [Bacillus sp. FJAT-42376]|uniref:VOC family protein n=1 Tax=Bacillus sp. FJAT-42376 TaxID=2014076 RepID=UPI003217C6B3